ncbi:MAG TPA: extracellular solute-binding protein [Streptosporangiaceae bacterium]|nr:extracellular solute-binding protein [Streptosporangiaceae bacterium]
MTVKQNLSWRGGFVLLACIGLAAAGCSSSSSSKSPGGSSHSSSSAPKPSGTAHVAYASSLSFLNEKLFGPAFETAEGFKYSGVAGASGALEAEIASKEISPGVFEAVGGDNITPLEPKFTSWYVQYASTSIVLAYNPKSKYASQFKAFASGKEPLSKLFTLLTTSGFKLGRTDPNIDPQGRAFIYMLELAQMKYHLPASIVTKILGGPLADAKSPEIFEEASLDSTLQSGQLDAASAYLNQAIELHLPYITLPDDINLGNPADASNYAKASITITGNVKKTGSPLAIDITTIGPPSPAALAFVKYVLSPAGLAVYKQGGYTLLKPTLTGSGAPSAVTSELGG